MPCCVPIYRGQFAKVMQFAIPPSLYKFCYGYFTFAVLAGCKGICPIANWHGGTLVVTRAVHLSQTSYSAATSLVTAS